MVMKSLAAAEKKNSSAEEYPRPQFKRDAWYDLNGTWAFAFDDDDIGEKEKWYARDGQGEFFTRQIEVPYAYQSKKSGIQSDEQYEVVWYRRAFHYEKNETKELLLHFEAVDYYTKVWVNGEFVGEHTGGHTPFSFPIGAAVQSGENTIVIRAEDKNSVEQPIGKQTWKSENFLCWYTRTTGIWQPVWMEEVSPLHIADLTMTPNIAESNLRIESKLSGHQQTAYLEAHVYYQGEWINSAAAWVKKGQENVEMTVNVESESADFRVFYWSPENPRLYDITLTLTAADDVADQVDSYFGMRSIEVNNGQILLNREEFYQKLILDQGYYKDALMTAGYDEMKADLLKVKEMGFNGVRRHQTIADRRYMYLCDQLGLVMWAEMPSFFSFTDQSMAAMLNESREMVKKHRNHPSVIIYTIMNESWGVNEIYHRSDQQNFVNALYYQTKAMDPSRLVVGNDGWEHTVTDILTIHDYNSNPAQVAATYQAADFADGSPSKTSRKQNFAQGYRYSGEPIIMSEFGGIAYRSCETGNEWGYGTRPRTEEQALERFEQLIEAVAASDSLQGFCYTQLTDVEQEVNGLLNHDHTEKFPAKRIYNIIASVKSAGFTFE
ncbi:glycoside hydrolase family 2 protein [Salisediminibacterium halotolerans]|uniref:Glycosyl hydrolases family 2 n=1 Tax=Salisediminibacterium halotolerans TaxID=517425 RepID=A0A1H9U9F8_9BACI|nr:sugar-binding domain-containing protein [Salisediminibacterium haloalkalitolerans]SES05858.1 Glycosyl hydrolases family 2 [Salisediminibacterium haloalkalitolerans]